MIGITKPIIIKPILRKASLKVGSKQPYRFGRAVFTVSRIKKSCSGKNSPEQPVIIK